MDKRTPLYEEHLALGARMVSFGGYEMPVQYSGVASGIAAEHRAVRSGVGIFDVSHMGEFVIHGPDARNFLQDVTINDVAALESGQAQYSAMCYSDGGMVDDLVLLRREEQYFMVVNAANIDKDFQWLQSNIKGEVSVEDHSDRYGLIAVQGPRSRELVQRVVERDLADLKFYHFMESERVDDGDPVLISRTGYTGELGYELFASPGATVELWRAFMAQGQELGLAPAGLGARDTLRMEMKYCLYGNDITAETNPIEAGLGWITKFDGAPFIGGRVLAEVKAQGPERRLVALEMRERAIPRQGYAITFSGIQVGHITSGTQSPTLGRGIGLGYVSRTHAKAGTELEVDIRGRSARAVVVKPPLVKGTSLLD